MQLKGIFRSKSALFQTFVLLSLMIAGAVASSILGLGILYSKHGVDADMFQHPNILRVIQFLSATGTFLIPALATAWLCSKRPSEYLSTSKVPSINTLSLTLYSVMLLSPTITLTGIINKAITLPDFMKPIELWMQQQEEAAEKITLLLLSGDSIFIFLFNIVVIAIAAGITEEFLFRGALQRIFEKWTKNPHIVIWTVAILFSAVHMQFYGFIPRLLLGAYFGYLLLWSKSIWVPVFAHFTNNAIAVIGMSFGDLKDNEFISGEIPSEDRLFFATVTVISFVLFILCVIRLRKRLST